MTLVRWNPSREMDTLHRSLNRMFDDVFVPANWRDFGGLATVPAAELTNTEAALLLKLEVPGMEAKDLDIEVTEDTVSICGERKSETRSEQKGTTRSEFRYGKFERVISLPTRIDNTNVTAEYKDGILHLTLPKVDATKDKVVKVNLESNS